MRLVALLAVASLATAAAAIACSSSPPQAANTQDDTSTTDPGDAAAAAPAPAPVAPVATVPASDAGVVVAIDTDASTVVPIQIPSAACIPGSIPETESNNTMATANPIPAVTSTFCGHLDPGDIDFVTFIMPAQVGEFGFGLDIATGPINLQPFAAGQPFDFNGNYPFLPGQPYTIQVSAGSAFPVDYRLSFQFQTF